MAELLESPDTSGATLETDEPKGRRRVEGSSRGGKSPLDAASDRLQVFQDNVWRDNPTARILNYAGDMIANKSQPKIPLEELQEKYPDSLDVISRFDEPITERYLQRVIERDRQNKIIESRHQQLAEEDAYMDYTFGEGRLQLLGQAVSEGADPVNHLLDAFLILKAPKLVGKFKYGAEVNRLLGKQKVLSGAAAGASANLAADALAFGAADLKESADRDYTAQDAALSIGLGAAFGGFFGQMSKVPELDEMAAMKLQEQKGIDPNNKTFKQETQTRVIQEAPETVEEVIVKKQASVKAPEQLVADAKVEAEKIDTDLKVLETQKEDAENALSAAKQSGDEDAQQDALRDIFDLDREIENKQVDALTVKDTIDQTEAQLKITEPERIADIETKTKDVEETKTKIKAEQDTKAKLEKEIEESPEPAKLQEQLDETNQRLDDLELERLDKQADLNQATATPKSVIDEVTKLKQNTPNWRRRVGNALFHFKEKIKQSGGMRNKIIRPSLDGKAKIEPISQYKIGGKVHTTYRLTDANGVPILHQGEQVTGKFSDVAFHYYDTSIDGATRARTFDRIALEDNFISWEVPEINQYVVSLREDALAGGKDIDSSTLEKALLAKYVRDLNPKEFEKLKATPAKSEQQIARQEILRRRLDGYDTSPADRLPDILNGKDVEQKLKQMYDDVVAMDGVEKGFDVDKQMDAIMENLDKKSQAELLKKVEVEAEKLRVALKEAEVCSFPSKGGDE